MAYELNELGICYENLNNGPTTRLICNHTFCLKCIMLYYQETRISCPMCRENIFSENDNIEISNTLNNRNIIDNNTNNVIENNYN